MAYNFSEVRLDSPVADVKSIANFRAFPLLLESVLIGKLLRSSVKLLQPTLRLAKAFLLFKRASLSSTNGS